MTVSMPSTAIPTPAIWLGGLGALPFVVMAAAHILSAGEIASLTGFALAAYGAVILSFLGGIQWGLAVAPGRPDAPIAVPLILSVVPSLTGWGALLLPDPANLLVLALTFLAVLALDLRAVRTGLAPGWYPRLRVPLSLVVAGALIAGATL